MRVTYKHHLFDLRHEGDLIRFWLLLRRQGRKLWDKKAWAR
jgi:hypothetical protein